MATMLALLLTGKHFWLVWPIFVHDVVEIIDSSKVLGSVIGVDNEKKFFGKINKTAKIVVKKLTVDANVSPQNVYKAFNSLVQTNWPS